MTLEVLSPPAFPCLIDSIQTLYYELMVGGSYPVLPKSSKPKKGFEDNKSSD